MNKTKIQQIAKFFFSTILIVLLGWTAVNAIGTLTPQGNPGDDTQVTLNEIYDKLADYPNAVVASSTSPFIVPEPATASFHTLSEIYSLLSAESTDLVPENIVSGTTIFGVTGTYSCGAPSCSIGQTSCNDVCVDLNTDDNNCGACGNTCANNEFCVAGVCFQEV